MSGKDRPRRPGAAEGVRAVVRRVQGNSATNPAPPPAARPKRPREEATTEGVRFYFMSAIDNNCCPHRLSSSTFSLPALSALHPSVDALKLLLPLLRPLRQPFVPLEVELLSVEVLSAVGWVVQLWFHPEPGLQFPPAAVLEQRPLPFGVLPHQLPVVEPVLHVGLRALVVEVADQS